MKKGAILLISGPSGCGKSSILKKLYEKIDNYYFSISTTTRKPREGEINGVDYFFTSVELFKKDIEENNFLEFAKVHNNYYGTSLKPVKEALAQGKLVIFDIDVQGYELARQSFNNIITSVFITTPTLKSLQDRLESRGTDNKDVILRRIENAKHEIQYIDRYDYFVINDDLNKAAQELESIAKIASRKTSLFDKEVIIDNWLH